MHLRRINGNLLLAAAVVTMLNFNSCKKYEDGPAFSLKSKTARLTGEWEVVSMSGQNLGSNASLILDFEKGGDFSYNIEYSYYGTDYSYSYDGKWEWDNKKETVDITIEGQSVEFDINRLTNSELWFTDSDNQEYMCEKK